MRALVWIAAGLLALAVGTGALFAKPWALATARAQAQKKGLEIEPESFSLGWMTARMENVRLRLVDVPSIEVHLKTVDARLGWSAPRLARIEVFGGRIMLTGELDQIRAELKEWRAARPAAGATSGAGGPVRTEIVRGLRLVWKDALRPGDEQEVQGIHFERGPSGQRIGVDLIQLQLDNLAVEIAGLTLEAASPSLDVAKLDVVHAAQARVAYRKALFPALIDPGKTKKPAAPAPDEKNTTGLDRLLAPHPERVARLRAAIALVRQQVLPKLPPQTKIEKLWLDYSDGEENLAVGPSILLAQNGSQGLRASVTPSATSQGTPLTVALKIPAKNSDAPLDLAWDGGPIALSTLGIKEGSLGLVGIAQTTIEGNVRANISTDGRTCEADGDLSIEGLTLDSRKLSPQLVSFPRLYLGATASWAVDGTSIEIKKAEASLGQARAEGDFSLTTKGDATVLSAHLTAPLVSCQALSESAPRGLLGAVEGIRFGGTFSLAAGVEANSKDLRNMQVRWDFDNGCRAQSVPPVLDPHQFRSLFRKDVLGPGNFPMQLEFGPLSSTWTPLDQVSRYLETALLVTEDGRFYRHNGFDDRAIESAIVDNTKAGSFVRGASTISMQLAKNLYLSRDKTLARKFQEAALTSLLEQSFSKHDLLELYVNIVEFGPGIYGVYRASEYYFSKLPQDLSPAQAFFLASILPAPSQTYFDPAGNWSTARRNYVRHLLKIAKKRGRLSDAELSNGLLEELVFGQAESLPAAPEVPEGALADAPLTSGQPSAVPGQPSSPPPTIPAPSTPAPAQPVQALPNQGQQPSPRPPVDPTRRGIHL